MTRAWLTALGAAAVALDGGCQRRAGADDQDYLAG